MAYIVADYYAPLTVAPTGSTEYIYATATHISYSASGAQFTGNGNSSYFGVGQTLQLPVSTPASGVFVHIIKATVGQQAPTGTKSNITVSKAVGTYTNFATVGTYQSNITTEFSLTTENASSLKASIANNPPIEHIIAVRFNYTAGIVEGWMDGAKCPNTYSVVADVRTNFGNPVFLGGSKTTNNGTDLKYVENTFLGTLRDFAQVNSALTDEEMVGITGKTIQYIPSDVLTMSPNTGSRGDLVTLTTTGMFDRPVYTGYDPCTNASNLVGTATLASDGKIGNAVTTPDSISSLACTNWTSTGSFSIAFWMKRPSTTPSNKHAMPWMVGSGNNTSTNGIYQYRAIFLYGGTTLYIHICRQGTTTGVKQYNLSPFTASGISVGDWFHFAMTMSNSVGTNIPNVYINGVLQTINAPINPSFTVFANGVDGGLYAHRIGGMTVPRDETYFVDCTLGCTVADYYWYTGIWTQSDVTKLSNTPLITFDDTNVTPSRFPDYNTAVITVP